MSMKSNRSGPVIFGGNALLKKKMEREVENSSEILSKPEYQNPIHKNKHVKDSDFDEEYAAWGW